MTALPQDAARSAAARLSLNSLRLLAARVAGQALAFVFTLFVARALGDAGFGAFAFISAVVAAGNVATTFGLDTLLLRDVAANRSPLRETIAAVLLIQLALSAAFILGVWLLGPRLPNQTAATLPALRLAALSLLPLAVSTTYSAVLRGRERMDLFLWFTLAAALAQAAGGFALWRGGGSLTGAAAVLLAAQLAGAAAAVALARRGLPGLPLGWALPSRAVLGRAWRVGAGLAALMILSVLYQRLGVILLSLLGGDAATGAYSAAARLLEALKLVPGAFFGALFPMAAAGVAPRAYRGGFAALLALAVLMAALTALFAAPAVRLLFGPEYGAAVAPLRVMAWSLPVTVVAFRLSFDLVVSGRERTAALAMLLTLAVAAPLAGWPAARGSAAGVAAALLAAEVAQVGWLSLLGRRGRTAG